MHIQCIKLSICNIVVLLEVAKYRESMFTAFNKVIGCSTKVDPI